MPSPQKSKPQSQPKAVISPARKAAFAILMAVEKGSSHSDELLRGRAVNVLSAADRNLATTLVLGVLRWQIRLDRQIRALLQRPNAKLDAEVLLALRLGAFQLLHLDRIPARAAIDESVELTKQSGHRFASGLVNAVLRKLAAQPEKDTGFRLSVGSVQPTDLSSRRIAPPMQGVPGLDFETWENEAEYPRSENPDLGQPSLSSSPKRESLAAAAHPAWMVERWTNFFGRETTEAICQHNQSQPRLTIRLASSAAEEELVAAGIRFEAGELLSSARTVVSGDVTATAAFEEGRIRLQDEGSQLVAELACSKFSAKEDSILDACAAPGGKTLILAERNPGARILACEASAPRLAQLHKRLDFLGCRVECRLIDASLLQKDASFDLVLADVPCSGTGTLGRNPEIRHRLSLEDFARQAERQRAILTAALRAVRPGGCLVYSTCSLEPEENEQVVAAVLAEVQGFRLLSLESSIEALRASGILLASAAEPLRQSLTPQGCLRLLPGKFHTDGFFVALIERTA
jgi:16S rRNA (cytosine967-C5)-methyltransferase